MEWFRGGTHWEGKRVRGKTSPNNVEIKWNICGSLGDAPEYVWR